MGSTLTRMDMERKQAALSFADDAVFLGDEEGSRQGSVNEFDTVCERQNLMVNIVKSKIQMFERGMCME